MKKHSSMGRISIHHLVPRQRMKIYYGICFNMPKNKIRLWRLRHDAWHVLFGNKTLNEVINYLGQKTTTIYGYKSITWKIVFGEKTNRQARRLLVRVRRIIRKQYSHLELDPALKRKIIKIENLSKNRIYPTIYLHNRFKVA